MLVVVSQKDSMKVFTVFINILRGILHSERTQNFPKSCMCAYYGVIRNVNFPENFGYVLNKSSLVELWHWLKQKLYCYTKTLLTLKLCVTTTKTEMLC